MSTYSPIQAITLTSTASAVDFTGIPQNFTDLVIIFNGTLSSGTSVYGIRYNSDAGSNYSWTSIRSDGSAATSTRDTNSTRILCGWIGTSQVTEIIQIQNYANITTNKTNITRNNSTAASTYVSANVGLWRNTAAITSVRILPDSSTFAAGSTFTLYGIQSGNVRALGGDIVVSDGTYWYHAFLRSGTFEPVAPVTADVLVVAGGGSGASLGGGGGAGGVLAHANQTVSSATAVLVGAGAAAGALGTNGSKGTASQFGSLTASVGGAGGIHASAGETGGSGGGGGDYRSANNAGTSGTTGQGFSGGNGWPSSNGTGQGAGAGGGGGAGGVGGNGTSNSGGAGGSGVNTYTNWGSFSALVSATGIGVSGFLAGGGGGGNGQTQLGGAGGAAGSGGGGVGATSPNDNATSGTANTGSGGGGGGNFTVGKAGGSGIVIVRYAV